MCPLCYCVICVIVSFGSLCHCVIWVIGSLCHLGHCDKWHKWHHDRNDTNGTNYTNYTNDRDFCKLLFLKDEYAINQLTGTMYTTKKSKITQKGLFHTKRQWVAGMGFLDLMMSLMDRMIKEGYNFGRESKWLNSNNTATHNYNIIHLYLQMNNIIWVAVLLPFERGLCSNDWLGKIDWTRWGYHTI